MKIESGKKYLFNGKNVTCEIKADGEIFSIVGFKLIVGVITKVINKKIHFSLRDYNEGDRINCNVKSIFPLSEKFVNIENKAFATSRLRELLKN